MEQLSNTLINRQLYKKAYLIEFYGKSKIEPDDIFTFSVPPESEELTYPQKKTETKTLGGLHIDDYGVDAVKVTLSGSTINQSIKRIYKGGFFNDKWLSGEGEIYHFRELILKHKKLEFLKDNPNAKILIYDLSKFTGLRLEAIDNYWQAFPGDFKIRRSSDRPFTYKYTFEFTGVPPTVTMREGLLPMGSNPLGALQTILNGLKTALAFANKVGALVDDAMGYVYQVSSLLNMVGKVMMQTTNTMTDIMDSAGNATIGLINGATSVVNGESSIVSLPRTIQLNTLSIGVDLQNAAKNLVKSIDLLSNNCRALFDDKTYTIPKRALDQYEMNNEEFKDFITTRLNEVENHANILAVYVKSPEIPDIIVGNQDSETGEPQIIASYGFSVIMLKDTDSLESLAARYLGDPDRAIDIAVYNNVASLNDLRPGDIIKIPIITQTAGVNNNLIFSQREDRDNYGRDIMLTDKGFIVVSNNVVSNNGDYELTSGVKNLSQAILLRIRENNAKRIRINMYGIRTNISDPTAGIAYIISSIKLTVGNDPRVAGVDDIQFKGSGDTLYVEVTYHDINNISGMVSGRV